MKQIIALFLSLVLFAGAATARCIPAPDAPVIEQVAFQGHEFEVPPVFVLNPTSDVLDAKPEALPPEHWDSEAASIPGKPPTEQSKWPKNNSKARWCH